MPSDAHALPPLTASKAKAFHSSRLHLLVAASRTVRMVSIGLLARLELLILSGHKDRAVLSAINGVRAGRESLMSGNEAFTVYSLARAQAGLGGSMARFVGSERSGMEYVIKASPEMCSDVTLYSEKVSTVYADWIRLTDLS